MERSMTTPLGSMTVNNKLSVKLFSRRELAPKTLPFQFTWIGHKCIHERIFEVVRGIRVVVVVLLVHCVNLGCLLKQASELLDFDC